MKKLVFTFVSLLLSLVASADTVLIDGIYYNLIAKAREAEVIQNPNKYTGCIEIPNSVIYNDVVYHVKSISNMAFFECPGVTKVIMPNSVTSIGKAAFYYCGADTIVISENLTSISDMAFACCQNMTSIMIPESVTLIDNSAFNGCVGLSEITIPDNVATIEDWAFAGCKYLSIVNIGNGLSYVGQGAFGDCPYLKSVNITDIAAWCKISFKNYNASPLRQSHRLYLNGEEVVDLIIPDNVTFIGDRCFSDLTNLNSVIVGNNVSSIGCSAFSNCSNLNSVTIGKNVTSIGESAFYGCKKIISMNIPSGVSYIGKSAFEGCSGLTDLIIPNNVTIIGYSAFKDCRKLSQVTLGSKINSIGSLAFASCQEITDVYCLAENLPSTYTDAFQDSYINYANLHVPTASIDAYRAAEPWKNFGAIMGLDGTTPEVKKCATPTIAFVNGELTFSCETEDVEFAYEITNDDVKKGYSDKVKIGGTYIVSVYATKTGYDNSDVATKEFTLGTNGEVCDVNQDGSIDVADIATIIDKMAGK